MDNTLHVFHASPHLIDQPSYDKCLENQTGHDNGRLGLWFAVSNTWIAGFGRNVYSFDLDLNLKYYHCTIGELASWAHSWAFSYEEKRTELLEQGYKFMLLEEQTGNIDMGVVLDFWTITNFKPVK